MCFSVENYATVTLNSARLQGVLTIGLPVEKNVAFWLDVSLLGVGRLRAVSLFSFESQYIESTLERGSGFRYMKG